MSDIQPVGAVRTEVTLAEGADKITLLIEYLYPIIAHIGDIDVAILVQDQAFGAAELTVSACSETRTLGPSGKFSRNCGMSPCASRR